MSTHMPMHAPVSLWHGRAWGLIRHNQGHYHRAVLSFETSMRILNEHDGHVPSKLHRAVGAAYAAMPRWKAALRSHKNAHALAEQEGDVSEQIEALRGLGVTTSQMGRQGATVKHYKARLALTRLIEDQEQEASALQDLANAYDERGEYQRAIALHEKQLSIVRSSGNGCLRTCLYTCPHASLYTCLCVGRWVMRRGCRRSISTWAQRMLDNANSRRR